MNQYYGKLKKKKFKSVGERGKLQEKREIKMFGKHWIMFVYLPSVNFIGLYVFYLIFFSFLPRCRIIIIDSFYGWVITTAPTYTYTTLPVNVPFINIHAFGFVVWKQICLDGFIHIYIYIYSSRFLTTKIKGLWKYISLIST